MPIEYNIVKLRGAGGINYELDYRAARAYLDMVLQARKDGIKRTLNLTSGYRSIERQKEILEQEIGEYMAEHRGVSREEAYKAVCPKYVARPGSSPHHSGRAIDMQIDLGIPNEGKYAERLRKTDTYDWLDYNANSYGFYPYPAEPWHWEYNPPEGLAYS